MKKRGFAWLAAVLAVVLVMGLRGSQFVPPVASSTQAGGGFWEAVRGLVGGSGGGKQSRPAPPKSVDLRLNGVPRHDLAAAGKAWPAPKRVSELTGRRTQYTKFFQLSDGRVQAEISQVPMHFRDERGGWRPIDTTVKASTRSGFVLANTTNAFASWFGGRSDRVVRFEADGRYVEMGLAGTPVPLSPKVDGSRVTFPGVAGGADLVYDVTTSALKESLVLAKAPMGGFSMTFTLQTGGLSAVQRQDGSIAFVGNDGSRAYFVMPAPYMFDSHDDAASPVGKMLSDKVTQTVSQQGSTATITLRADAAWLADPARVYPVTFDPTVKVQPVPSDGQDVQIYSGSTTTNYNDTYQLKVGTDATQTWRTLVRFPLTGVPAGTQLDDAQLQLYYDQTHTAWQYDVALEARRVTAPWTESTATWANMSANLAAQPAGNMVTVDDGDPGTTVSGAWPYSTNATLTPKAINGDYRYNNDATAGDTHTWVPTITEPGDYQVEVHYTSESDRATNAPYTVFYAGGSKTYTVDQTGAPDGVWKTLGVHPFVAGTTGRVVLGDVAGKSVIADAVRFTKWGAATKKSGVSSVWSSFAVRNVVQDWVNGTQPNYGFMVKAVDEGVKGRGGPVYEASEYAYENSRRDYNLPKLVLTWGRPGVAVDPPTTITATGAALTWPSYVDPTGPNGGGDDIVEYQVHRSVYQTYTPSAATLVAPVASGSLSYQDTTAVPTPTDETDPLKRHFYYYMVAVRTADGQVVAGPTQGVLLPKAGQITKIFRETATNQVPDTTLSQLRPDSNVNVYDGDPYVAVGNNSSFYGDTRGVVRFGNLAGIPAAAQVVDAQLRMWNTYLYPGTVTTGKVDVHRLTRAFDETTATWNKANATTGWTTPGGDFDPVAESYFDGFTNDPEWESWTATNTVRSWLANPASNYGFLLKMRDESVATQRAMLLSAEAAEPMLRPTLQVTYLEPTSTSTYFAPYTPARMIPGDVYPATVTVSNPTSSSWGAADWELSYHWTLPDGTDVTTAGNQVPTALPKDIAPGATVDIAATVKTPIQSDAGNKRRDHVLRWELHNKTTGQWLSATSGIASLDQSVAVEEPTSDQLGVEKFYPYSGMSTGAGSLVMNNLFAGNTVWSYNAFANPSRGLSTFVRMAYNSQDTSDTVAGYGWSLQASSLMRLGTPLDFHPNPDPTTVKLTDGDGTTHTFSWNASVNEWQSPAGVHLFLQRLVVCNRQTEESRAWSLTRPDRAQFFYDCDGYLSSIEDNNGNTMTFTYEVRRSQNKPTKFLRYITDPVGRQTLTIQYWAKGDTYDYIDDTTWAKVTGQTNLTNPKIIDHVRSITDISGRKLTFTYTDKGLLGELIDGVGSAQPKVFGFQYDMTQGNKNVKLVKVTDPRGHATNLAYYSRPEDDPKFKWNTKSYTDRLGNPKSFAYTDPDGTAGSTISTTVLDAKSHATTYLTDGHGRPTQLTNAKNEVTKLGWDADNNVVRLEEANGAVTTYAYDQKTGYPTEIKDAEAVRNGSPGITLAYQTGLNGHLADLIAKQSPEGRRWTFGYDTEGDLTSVTDPVGNTTPAAGDYTTTYTYDTWGQLLTARDANGNLTTNANFDPNGYPQTITDAVNNATTFVYDARGQVTKVTDALGKNITQTYDTFGRPLVSVVPKDQANGVLITTAAPTYDANDNVTASIAPNGAVTSNVYDDDDGLISVTAPKHNTTDPARVTSMTYDQVGNLTSRVEPLGNLTPNDPADYRTTYGYDEVNQLTSITDARGGTQTFVLDNVGNLVKFVDARKSATADPADNAGTFGYDLVHRRTTVTDALGNTSTRVYDRDGFVVAQIDRAGRRSEITLDPRGAVVETRVPRRTVDGTTEYAVTRYEYDQVGNRTKAISPRGVATTDDADDFAQVTVFDQLNRVKEQIFPYDKDDARYNTPDKVINTYDAVGRLAKVSAPPSQGQTVRNDTTYSYFDNGWQKSSTDMWGISTSYDYDQLGNQTSRTVTSAGGSSSRTMSWSYFPDGALHTRSDDGVPVGKAEVLVDNSDSQNVTVTGVWSNGTPGPGFVGYDCATHAAGTGSNTFTWRLYVPQAGTYDVQIRYPTVAGAATDARFTVNHAGGSTTTTVNQATGGGTWVSLGSFSFAEGNTHSVSLSDQASGTVVADAVKLVRNNSGDVDTEAKDYTYGYDANDNLTTIADNSSGALVDAYSIGYTMLDQIASVEERKSGVVKHSTQFSYNENGNLASQVHDGKVDTFEYDVRGLISKITNAESATDPQPKVTTYTYTPLGQTQRQTKANGNTVDYDYFFDGALQHQLERRADGTTVAEHTYEYDLNDNRSKDTSKLMNADNHSAYLNRVLSYTYDPRDRLATVTKTGDGAGSETYVHDANNNVISQTVNGVTTTAVYDRDRLLSANRGGQSNTYNYDPFGRLDTVTVAGEIATRYVYDGFDRVVEQRTRSGITRRTYDPLDRTATETTGAGTANETTTTFTYLGLSEQVVAEQATGKVNKTYQYAPWGERLSQVTTKTDGTKESSYFVYNAHNDVEAVTGSDGSTLATYGYTAYGSDDTTQFTGEDKPDPINPDKLPYNSYRYNGMRWQSGGNYDMGFRDYDPGLNRFLTRDSYVGALADMRLTLDPWTGNRYAFAGGNPISRIELDGHHTGHDAAVIATALLILEWAAANGINGRITIDVGEGGRTANEIPGGHKSGSGKTGYADIIFWGEDIIYVWEVKIASKGGRQEAPGQLNRYIIKLREKLQKEGNNTPVKPGFPLATSPGVPSDWGDQRVWSESTGNPAVRYYAPSKKYQGSGNSGSNPGTSAPAAPAQQPGNQPGTANTRQPTSDGAVPGSFWGDVLLFAGVIFAIELIIYAAVEAGIAAAEWWAARTATAAAEYTAEEIAAGIQKLEDLANAGRRLVGSWF